MCRTPQAGTNGIARVAVELDGALRWVVAPGAMPTPPIQLNDEDVAAFTVQTCPPTAEVKLGVKVQFVDRVTQLCLPVAGHVVTVHPLAPMIIIARLGEQGGI